MRSLIRAFLRRYPALRLVLVHRLVFGNMLPLLTNVRFLSHWRRCCAALPPTHPGKWSPEEAGETEIDYSAEDWMVQVRDSMATVPDAVQLLRPEIITALEAYYRSHWKNYGLEAYRSTVMRRRAAKLSSLWHMDNYPPTMMKVFIYLIDCKTGALHLLARDASRRLFRQGFFDRYPAERFVGHF